MTCPDCGLAIQDSGDLAVGRRVHRLTVGDDGTVALEGTVLLWHCENCDIVVGVSDTLG